MKKFLGLIFALLLVTNSAFAMKFSPPVKIGEIGFPVQAPYSGFIVYSANSNTGTPYNEEHTYKGAPLQTYKKGVATFGGGKDALFCSYDFDAEDFNDALKFGGRNNFILNRAGTFNDILKIETDKNLTLYVIYHNYCTSDLNIIGINNGAWQNYIDSKKISAQYFDGNDGYKMDGSVIYELPTCSGDKIIIPYHRWHWKGESETEGEIILKWNDAAQKFSIDKKNY